MNSLPKKLQEKIIERKNTNAYRDLPENVHQNIDFISNDYLGLGQSELLFDETHQMLLSNKLKYNGSTGSRLISGNHKLYNKLEHLLINFYKSENALVYNSGYDANIGFFAAVPQRNDIVLYDEFIHASIRDGISMGIAKSYKFKHNNLNELDVKLDKITDLYDNIYVVTESVFSMDGDSPDIEKLVSICSKHNVKLVIDEAHAVGVMGKNLSGLIAPENCFAKIVTFGKAFGTHGAAILCRSDLKNYLINFSRSFIYTTALSPHSIASIIASHQFINTINHTEILTKNIQFFKLQLKKMELSDLFTTSTSAIQSCIIKGNDNVKAIAKKMTDKGFLVKPILHPTVPKNQERLRFCLHSYNTDEEISALLQQLAIFVK